MASDVMCYIACSQVIAQRQGSAGVPSRLSWRRRTVSGTLLGAPLSPAGVVMSIPSYQAYLRFTGCLCTSSRRGSTGIFLFTLTTQDHDWLWAGAPIVTTHDWEC